MNPILKIFGKQKLKTHLIDDKYKVVEAFRLGGKVYYMYEDVFNAPTGRQFAALAIYDELQMRCNRDYLVMHVKAVDKVLSDPKKINLTVIMQLNHNLKERLQMIPLPDYVYKLASVMYFDESESPYSYDFEYNEKKIKKWKEAGGTLDFFLKTPLVHLIPSMNTVGRNLKEYFQVAKLVDKTHRKHLTDILSEET